MSIKRRLTVIGILITVLSVVMATQYSITRVAFSYSIVHPSEADIRLIGSDNATDGRLLRVVGTNGSATTLQFEFGNWSVGTNKTFTAAFGIVNEESFAVNITHINLSMSNGNDYFQIFLHGDRDQKAEDDPTSVFLWNNGSLVNGSDTVAWTLDAGNMNSHDMSDGSSSITTGWDSVKGVRYSMSDLNAMSGVADFVWVQISINIPFDADDSGDHSGTMFLHFEAGTHYVPAPPELSFGSAVVFENADTDLIAPSGCAAFNDSFIIIGYKDGGDSGNGTAIIGEISGTSLTFGNPVVFADYTMFEDISCTTLNDTHAVICWHQATAYGSGPGWAVVAVRSGTSISLGTAVKFCSPNDAWGYSVDSLNQTHIVISWNNLTGFGNFNYSAIVGKIIGESISFGSETTFGQYAGSSSSTVSTTLDETHVCVAYDDGGNSEYGTAIIGTITGESISFGSAVVFESSTTNYISTAALDSNHVAIAYRDDDNSGYGTLIIGTISGGNNIAFGNPAVFESELTKHISVDALDSIHVIVAYEDDADGDHGTAIIGTISGGDTITFDDPIVFENAAVEYTSVAKLDSTKAVIAYVDDDDDSDHGTAIVGTYE